MGVELRMLSFVYGERSDVLFIVLDVFVADLDFREPDGILEMLIEAFQEDLSDGGELV